MSIARSYGPKPVQHAQESDAKKSSIKTYILSLFRDVLIAVIIMCIIIGSLYAYTNNWPPMVVVESKSMMHGDDSQLGVIDTGDLVLVKKVLSRGDVITYIEGKSKGYKTYGEYGDVIVYRKNGGTETPVIHRAVVWVDYNSSGGGSFDIPSMGLYGQRGSLTISEYGFNKKTLVIRLDIILNGMKLSPHGGILTKGDNNFGADQESLPTETGGLVQPVKIDWIVGKGVGEMPWFGLIKLYVGGDLKDPPPTSVNMLIDTIILIIVIPIILDISIAVLTKWKKNKDEKQRKNQSKPRPPVSPSVRWDRYDSRSYQNRQAEKKPESRFRWRQR